MKITKKVKVNSRGVVNTTFDRIVLRLLVDLIVWLIQLEITSSVNLPSSLQPEDDEGRAWDLSKEPKTPLIVIVCK